MQRLRCRGRQQILQKITGLNPDQKQVGEPRAAALPVELAQPPQQALDTDEITIGMPEGVLQQERAVAAAQFDFQRLGLAKHAGRIETVENGSQRMNQSESHRGVGWAPERWQRFGAGDRTGGSLPGAGLGCRRGRWVGEWWSGGFQRIQWVGLTNKASDAV